VIKRKMIQVLIRPPIEKHVRAEFVEQVVLAVLDHESISTEADISVVLTDDAEMQSLNAQFRGINEPTDVLSFAEEETQVPFVNAPDELPYLGDVIISFPRAQSQARGQNHSTQDELRLLIVHGVLHLLGYDHATPAERARMWARQDAILSLRRA
jgi:probable rRNA maturation factor